MKNKTLYFDVETTGLDPQANDIIQIAGIIEEDGKEVERFDFKLQPTNWDNISPQALETHGYTIEQLKEFDLPNLVHEKLVKIFDAYIDKFNKFDKFVVCGYNARFDINFLKNFFQRNANDYLFSYFGVTKDPLGVINYLKAQGKLDIPNAKLETICEHFDIKLDNAHDAMGDIEATRELVKKVDQLLENV